jgi:hypothetical protein
MSTVAQMASQLELWKNTAAGMRWYISVDIRGQQKGKTVQGGRTFTLSTFERQINQELAASPQQDLFRNGTFVLARSSDDTNEEEVQSPNALTDQEIETIVQDVVFGDLKIDDVIAEIDSGVTLFRLYEAFTLEEKTPSRVKAAVKKKRDSLEATVANERTIATTSPDEE